MRYVYLKCFLTVQILLGAALCIINVYYLYIVLQIKYVPHDSWNRRVPLPYPRQVVSLFALICHKILMDRWERRNTFYLCKSPRPVFPEDKDDWVILCQGWGLLKSMPHTHEREREVFIQLKSHTHNSMRADSLHLIPSTVLQPVTQIHASCQVTTRWSQEIRANLQVII